MSIETYIHKISLIFLYVNDDTFSAITVSKDDFVRKAQLEDGTWKAILQVSTTDVDTRSIAR